MATTKNPTLRSGATLPLSTPNSPHVFTLQWANQMEALYNALMNCPQLCISENNIVVNVKAGAQIPVKLYDPAKSCAAGTFYKVRITDASAVTGIEVSAGVFIKAKPGKYLCLKSVAANPTLAKQIPSLPDGSGQTDPAHADKYFEWFSPAVTCTDEGPVVV